MRRLQKVLEAGVERLIGRLGTPLMGAETVEYALVVAGIALAALAAVQAFGNGIAAVFGRLLQRISGIG